MSKRTRKNKGKTARGTAEVVTTSDKATVVALTKPAAGRTGSARPARRRRWLNRLGWYEISEEAILTSTRQAEALNPALVSTHPPLAGPLLGLDAGTGQPQTEDPHELYEAGRITSPNVVVFGDVGSGKSTLVKNQYVVRPVALGRQVVVFDRKLQQGRGEYGRAAQVTDGTVIRFDRRDGAVVNILDPRIATTSSTDQDGTVGQDLLLLMVAEYAHGPLESRSRYALRTAHRTALARARGEDRVATLRDVVDALYRPDGTAVPRKHLLDDELVTADDVLRWGLDLALDLERFLDGDLSGLIDGPTRAEDGGELDLSAPLLVIDTSALDEDSPALSLVMATMATYLSAVWSKRNGRRLLVIEEGYHAARLPSVAAIFRSLAKRGRGIGLSVVTVFHHISDVPDTSDIMSLIREAGVVHVFRQGKTDDAAAAVNLFGLPTWVGPELALLERGVHVCKIGKEAPTLVVHVRTPLEEWVTDTDAAMLGQDVVEASPFSDLTSDTDLTAVELDDTEWDDDDPTDDPAVEDDAGDEGSDAQVHQDRAGGQELTGDAGQLIADEHNERLVDEQITLHQPPTQLPAAAGDDQQQTQYLAGHHVPEQARHAAPDSADGEVEVDYSEFDENSGGATVLYADRT
jgi:hypothetical protein